MWPRYSLTFRQNIVVEIGSYPFSKENRFGTSIVMRSTSDDQLSKCDTELKELVKNYDTKY